MNRENLNFASQFFLTEKRHNINLKNTPSAPSNFSTKSSLNNNIELVVGFNFLQL